MCWPGTLKFKTYLREGMIRNWRLHPEYSVRADHIYGPAISIIQWGIKHHRKPAKRLPRVSPPTDISLHHKNIELYVDFLNMNGMFFLHKSHPRSLLSQQNCTSKSTHFKEHVQDHKRIEQSHQNVQGKRLQHRCVKHRQRVQLKWFEGSHQEGDLKNLFKRMTHYHHQ